MAMLSHRGDPQPEHQAHQTHSSAEVSWAQQEARPRHTDRVGQARVSQPWYTRQHTALPSSKKRLLILGVSSSFKVCVTCAIIPGLLLDIKEGHQMTKDGRLPRATFHVAATPVSTSTKSCPPVKPWLNPDILTPPDPQLTAPTSSWSH